MIGEIKPDEVTKEIEEVIEAKIEVNVVSDDDTKEILKQLLSEKESEIDENLKHIITPYTKKKDILHFIADYKTLEEEAKQINNNIYRRIRLKRIMLDSKFDDLIINPFVEVSHDDREIASKFLPNHKLSGLETLVKIIANGKLSSSKALGILPLEERVKRGQEDSIFISAGAPYSHLKIMRESGDMNFNRHNLPLIVFTNDLYERSSFKATPRDSFSYDDEMEIREYTLSHEDLETYIKQMVADNKVLAEQKQFRIRSDRMSEYGTFFPEITIDGEISLNEMKMIILTRDDKAALLKNLFESNNFRNLIGKKVKSITELENILTEKFGFKLVIPDDELSVDQMYWRIIGFDIPEYAEI
ncbi:hypothetical protein J4232_04895 [Candidatus Woesearchaeota archaeon]|nr:hypothetical protein [Candidatus Woesearchaeota archaeon]